MNDKEPFAHKKLLAILVFLITVVVSAIIFSRVLLSVPLARFSTRAIIVDQLGSEFPNSDFNSNGKVADELRSAGFEVSYQTSEAVTVEFYLGLAKGDYGIIILRAHSAMRVDASIVDFFTSEAYSASKYGSYQQDGRVTVGSFSWRPQESFFAVSPELIRNLDGAFPKSIIVAMGCNGLNSSALEMAEAFVQKKGALAYVGWNGLVSPSHTDSETLKLLDSFLLENRTMGESIRSTGVDPDYFSSLAAYPTNVENLTKNDLLINAEGSQLLYCLTHLSENEFSVIMLFSFGTLVARRLQVYLWPNL